MRKISPKRPRRVNLAIVGVGHLGSKHLKVYCGQLAAKAQVVTVCDINRAAAEKASQPYRIKVLEDYRQLTSEIEAVNICTPTSSHFEIARFFLKQGVHTFIEKPITLTLKEADILIGLAQKKNLKLQVGHVERFNAAFQAIRSLAPVALLRKAKQRGRALNPLFVECHRLNHFPNRSLDLNVVTDLMIHDIDIVLGLVDSPIQDIQAVGVNVLTDLEDIANARLTFQNGCVCNLTASRVSDEVMRKIRIFLKDTYISLDYVKQEAFLYKKNGASISKTSLPIEKEEPLKKELESFLDCILQDTQPLVSGVEGRMALEVALKITQTLWKNPSI